MDASDELAIWARGIIRDVDVTASAPVRNPPSERGVSVYLLELRARPALRSTRRDPFQVTLDHLVTTWAPRPVDANRMLLDLAFAAMDAPGYDVELDPPDTNLWLALGVTPRPAFRLRVPERRERPQTVAPPVLRPLVVQGAPLGSVGGWVRTPDDLPIPDATVELPGLDRRSHTDRHGHFDLDALPIGAGPLDIRVRARGREVWASVDGSGDRHALLIRLDPLEDSDAGIPHP